MRGGFGWARLFRSGAHTPAIIPGGLRMNRFTLRWTFAAALLAPGLSYSQVSCTHEGLQAAADLYIAAQAKGDTDGLPLAKGLAYIENFKTTNISDGLIKKAMQIGHHRSLVDTSTCQTFTEV